MPASPATPDLAPARVGTLRDKLIDLAHCGVDQTVVLPFDARLANLSPQAFIDQVLLQGLGARYVLVGDDFRFGQRRAGDYAMLDAAGLRQGFDVARMNSYEVHGLRVSSSAVREALAEGRMADATRLMGHPYRISGHVVHGRKLGRSLGFKTLNQRFAHWKPAASGIFAVLVHGLSEQPLRGVANLGVRPSLDPKRCQWRAGAAGNPLPGLARRLWARKVPTVKSCAWNFSTNCTTNSNTTPWTP